jgi:hypothetical protein
VLQLLLCLLLERDISHMSHLHKLPVMHASALVSLRGVWRQSSALPILQRDVGLGPNLLDVTQTLVAVLGDVTSFISLCRMFNGTLPQLRCLLFAVLQLLSFAELLAVLQGLLDLLGVDRAHELA